MERCVKVMSCSFLFSFTLVYVSSNLQDFRWILKKLRLDSRESLDYDFVPRYLRLHYLPEVVVGCFLSHSCACAFGFHATFCEVNVDDCQDHGCENGATCVDGVGNYTCLCSPDYTGTSQPGINSTHFPAE